jgi:hypothetical protein
MFIFSCLHQASNIFLNIVSRLMHIILCFIQVSNLSIVCSEARIFSQDFNHFDTYTPIKYPQEIVVYVLWTLICSFTINFFFPVVKIYPSCIMVCIYFAVMTLLELLVFNLDTMLLSTWIVGMASRWGDLIRFQILFTNQLWNYFPFSNNFFTFEQGTLFIWCKYVYSFFFFCFSLLL